MQTIHTDINGHKFNDRMDDYMSEDLSKDQNKRATNPKQEQLDQYRIQNTGKPMTTNQGRKISNDSETLKAGERGPSLHEALCARGRT